MRRLLAASVLLAAALACGGAEPGPPPRDPAVEFAARLRGGWLSRCLPGPGVWFRERITFGEATVRLEALRHSMATCGGGVVVQDLKEGTYLIGPTVPQTVDGHDVTAFTVTLTFPAELPMVRSTYVDLAPEPDGLFLEECAAWDCEWIRPAAYSREAR